MMDCKHALTEAKGDLEQAVVLLRKKGISVAGKKASRVTKEGAVASYIHAGGKIGVLLEINCESDFVARTDDFKELVHDIAMHIAASDPKFVRKEDVTPEAFEREKDIYRSQAAATGKPPQVVEKIVEGKMSKFYEEVCLLEQPFIRDQTVASVNSLPPRSASWARTSRCAALPASRWEKLARPSLSPNQNRKPNKAVSGFRFLVSGRTRVYDRHRASD